jgi:hypothetical protein
MTLTRKDAAATVLTALAVLAFVATHEAWNVWLIGSSHRWAAGAITVLGMMSCSLGSAGAEMGKHPATRLLAVVGTAVLVFAVWAIATGSLTALALLVVADIVLWGGATLRHAWPTGTHGPVTT